MNQEIDPDVLLPADFVNDSIIFSLFSMKNLTASADGLEWDNKTWSIDNHFIPFHYEQVGAFEPFKSTFMYDTIKDLKFSKEARAVMNEGLKIWKLYFNERHMDTPEVIEKYKLQRSDVGWYQIRQTLKIRYNGMGWYDKMKNLYEVLRQKIEERVYEYGILKDREQHGAPPIWVI